MSNSVALWTVPYQTPLSMGFSRQEYWSGLPFPFFGDLPDPGMEPMSVYVSCIRRQILYHYCHWEAPVYLWWNVYSLEEKKPTNFKTDNWNQHKKQDINGTEHFIFFNQKNS